MTFEVACLSKYLTKFHDAKNLYVAYSGGLDSHVLLHAIASLVGANRVIAVHVNHQLSSNANKWQRHCEEQCSALGVNLVCELVDVSSTGSGLEQAARKARYDTFEKLLKKNDLLILAHHADDQAETILYRLFRGSGIKGISGIPETRSLGDGKLFRPLLDFSRADLESYASTHDIKWVEDESNQEIVFDRNFIRHKVLPVVTDRWPELVSQLSRSAKIYGEAGHLLNVLAEQDLKSMREKSERVGWSISIDMFKRLEKSRQKNLIRHWVAEHKMPLPPYNVLDALLNQMLLSSIDAQPLVSWSGVELRRFNKKLYLFSADFDNSSHIIDRKKGISSPAQLSISWDGFNKILLPNNSSLSTKISSVGGLKIHKKNIIEIRFRAGGERCKPFGRSGTNTLKKLFQEHNLEPWLRNKVPLVYVDGTLAAVGDLWVCDDFFALTDETGVELKWSFSKTYTSVID